MAGTSLTEFSRLLVTLYRSAQELPVHQFQDAVLEAIKPSLPFDASIWGTASMAADGIDIHSLHRHQFPEEMMAAFERVKHQDSAAVRVTGQPTMTIGFSAREEFAGEHQADIRRFSEEYSVHHCFITADIHPATAFAQWVSLFRSDPERPCSEPEIELLSELAPHLMQALAINRLVHLDRLVGDTARERWSVAIADTRGMLYHADARFRDLVGPEWPFEQPDQLPRELVQRLLQDEERMVGRHVVVQRTLDHGLLYLRARERHEVDSLSSREFMVASLLATGLTQKQIALKVERSPETVHSQVKAIFEKLRINNVAPLATLLALRQ
jgi:DNA-binding CsgD family transcriptional regulator